MPVIAQETNECKAVSHGNLFFGNKLTVLRLWARAAIRVNTYAYTNSDTDCHINKYLGTH